MGAPLNLIGQRFHRLVVIERIPSSPTQKLVMWRCKCDCGNTAVYSTGALRSGRTYSCGCYRQEITSKVTEQPIKPKLGMVNDTNASRISSNRPSRNNKLGMRGVSMTKRGKFVAFIYFKKERRYLGTFDTPEEAKAAYDGAWEERKERTDEELNGEWAPKEVDISGQRFGKLTALHPVNRQLWHCRCDCGNECDVRLLNLMHGGTRSCGCMKTTIPHKDITGQRFGKLTAIRYEGKSKWLCRCDCGQEAIVNQSKLSSGHTKSCGCLRRKRTDP